MAAHVARARSRELPALIAMRTWIAHVVSLLVRYRACIMHHRGLFDKEKDGRQSQPSVLYGSGAAMGSNPVAAPLPYREVEPRCRIHAYG